MPPPRQLHRAVLWGRAGASGKALVLRYVVGGTAPPSGGQGWSGSPLQSSCGGDRFPAWRKAPGKIVDPQTAKTAILGSFRGKNGWNDKNFRRMIRPFGGSRVPAPGVGPDPPWPVGGPDPPSGSGGGGHPIPKPLMPSFY